MAAPCVADAGNLLEDFTDYTDWTADTGVTANNVARWSQTAGKVSLWAALSATANNTTFYYITKTVSLDLSTDKSGIELVFYSTFNPANTAGIVTVKIEFSSTSDFSKSFSYTTPTRVHFGWNKLHIAESEWTDTGGEDWSSIIRFRIGMKPVWTGAAPRLAFDSLYGGVSTYSSCVLCFANAWQEQLTVHQPQLAAYGWTGHVFLDGFSMNGSGRLTSGQYKKLVDLGWSIGADIHQTDMIDPTYDHTVVTRYDAIMMEEIVEAYRTLFRTEKFSMPEYWLAIGNWREDIQGFYKMMSTQTAKFVLRSRASSETPSMAVPLINPWNGVYMVWLDSGTSLATAEAAVDLAILRGGAVAFMLERATTSPDSDDWDIDDWTDLLAYIDTSGISVKNLNEFYDFNFDAPSLPVAPSSYRVHTWQAAEANQSTTRVKWSQTDSATILTT